MKHKVVFYNPKAPYYTLPLQFLALSSVVDRDRFDVVIIDARIERKPHELLRSHLRDALCLGISVITGIPIKDAVEVSRMAKRNFPNVKIIWGGWHPSILPEQCLQEGYADVAVVGQGELTFLEVLDRLAEGKSLEGVNGCVFKEGNEIHVNAIRKFVDINNFPPYDYDLVPLEKYFRFKGIRQIDFYSSQGCPYRCAFCADPYVYNRRWSGLKGSRMLLDVFDVLKRYRVDDILFQDENFFASQKRVLQFAEGIQSSGVKFTWAATSRADQAAKLDDRMLKEIAESNCRKIMIGAESGSQEMLDKIKKDTLVEETILSAEKLHSVNIGAAFGFIVGFPEEDFNTTLQTLDTIKKIKAIDSRFEFNIFFYTPYPGTELYDYIVRKGYRLPQSLAEWSDIDFILYSGYWVSKREREYVERFKFYNKLGFNGNGSIFLKPLYSLAALRRKNDFYSLPVEKNAINFVRYKVLGQSNW